MSMSRWEKKTGKWCLVGMCTLGSFGWIALLFSDDVTYESPDDPLAVVDVTEHTPYVDMVAARLKQDPIFVDPVLAGTIGESLDTDRVRAAVAESETPVYVLALPTQGRSTDEDEVVPAKIADAMGDAGVFLSFDESGKLTDLTHGLELDGYQILLPSIYDSSFNEEAVVDTIEDVDPKVDEIQERIDEDDSFFASPFVLGLLLGLTFSVPLWYVMKFIRWSASRDRSYLKGFRE